MRRFAADGGVKRDESGFGPLVCPMGEVIPAKAAGE
jgi:hypothetical protein